MPVKADRGEERTQYRYPIVLRQAFTLCATVLCTHTQRWADAADGEHSPCGRLLPLLFFITNTSLAGWQEHAHFCAHLHDVVLFILMLSLSLCKHAQIKEM